MRERPTPARPRVAIDAGALVVFLGRGMARAAVFVRRVRVNPAATRLVAAVQAVGVVNVIARPLVTPRAVDSVVHVAMIAGTPCCPTRVTVFDTPSTRRDNAPMEADGSWWCPWSSKPAWGVKSVPGVFDSHTPPPCV